jgi:hypothetical protein
MTSTRHLATMTTRTPGGTAGLDNRWTTRSPFTSPAQHAGHMPAPNRRAPQESIPSRNGGQIHFSAADDRTVGNLGVEPSSSCSQSRRVAVSLVPGRAGQFGNVGRLVPGQALSARLLQPVRGPLGIRTPTFLLAGQTLSQLKLEAQVPGGWRLPADAHAVQLTMCWHVHPAGWCSQGPQGSNPHHRFWRPVLYLIELDPSVNMRTAPSGLSRRGGSWFSLVLLSRNLPAPLGVRQ